MRLAPGLFAPDKTGSKFFAGKGQTVLVPDTSDADLAKLRAAVRKFFGHCDLNIARCIGDFGYAIRGDADKPRLRQGFLDSGVYPITSLKGFEEAVADVLNIVTLSDIEAKPIDWLWINRFARGKINLVFGEGEVSKTTFLIYLAARITKGEAWPNAEGVAPQGHVVMLTCEDDPADTIKPRFCAAQGDDTKLHIIQGVPVKTENEITERMFSLGDDLNKLDHFLKHNRETVAVIIDPLNSYFGGKLDSFKGPEVRAVLAPYARLAEKHRVAIIIICHVTKEVKQTAVARILGTVDIGNLARTAWAIVANIDEEGRESKTEQLLLRGKMNIGPRVSGLSYHLVEQPTGLSQVPTSIVCSFSGSREIDKTATEAIKEMNAKRNSKVSDDVQEAMNIIRRQIETADKLGRRTYATDIQKELKDAGFTPSNVRTACQKLGATA